MLIFPLRRVAMAAALLTGLLVTANAPAQVRLPALGDSVSEDFGLNDERRLGEQIMREIRRDPDYLDDPLLLEYINTLWQPLVGAARVRGDISPDSNFAWEAFLVRDRAVNAFALPGGFVGVYLGLIAITADRDELGSVLAHELTHVTQRHIARSMVNAKRQGMAGIAAMILGVLAASRASNSDAAQAVIVGSQAAMAQGQLNFSRDMEREADRIGIELMSSAGYSPSGMAGMFEKLEAASRLNDSNQYPYLRSHPLTVERISDARLRSLGRSAGAAAMPAEHALMQARARVLMDTTEPALRRAQGAGAPGSPAVDTTRLGALYASALASVRLRETDRADAAIAAGSELAARQFAAEPRAARAFAMLRVAALIDRGAASALPAALKPLESDRSRAAMLLRAHAALAAPDDTAGLRRTAEALQAWVAEHPSDALAWNQLSQTADALGQKLRSLRAAAEAAYATGHLLGAMDRLRAAQRVARESSAPDFVESSIIDTRLRELEAIRRRLIAEARGE